MSFDSLQNLIDISNSPTLCGAVHTLEISTQHLSRQFYERRLRPLEPSSDLSLESDDDGLSTTFGLDEEDIDYINSMRDEDKYYRDEVNNYLTSLEEQEKFTSSGLDMAFLIRAMTKLPNCTKICVSDTHRPWGSARLARISGHAVHRGFDPDSQDSQAFVKHLLKTTIAATSASRIRVVEIDVCLGLEPRNETWAISAAALDLPINVIRLAQKSVVSVKN